MATRTMSFYEKAYMEEGVYKLNTTKVTVTKAEPSLIRIPLDKLFELYGNLVMAGFEKDEALSIVNTVITNA
jgi:hypothetical protein